MCVHTRRSPYPLIIIHGQHLSLHKIKMMRDKESFHVDPKGDRRGERRGEERDEGRGIRGGE